MLIAMFSWPFQSTPVAFQKRKIYTGIFDTDSSGCSGSEKGKKNAVSSQCCCPPPNGPHHGRAVDDLGPSSLPEKHETKGRSPRKLKRSISARHYPPPPPFPLLAFPCLAHIDLGSRAQQASSSTVNLPVKSRLSSPSRECRGGRYR